MDIALSDIKILNDLAKSKNKQTENIRKYHEIKNKQQKKKILTTAINGYEQIYNNIISNKQNQYQALITLMLYLDNLNDKHTNSKSLSKQITTDQRSILRELNNIQNDLDTFKGKHK